MKHQWQISPTIIKYVPINELFCIDQEDIPFGGNWNSNFINYIEIDLYLCEERIYFNSTDPRCSKLINLFKDINSSLSFDFYYPIVEFQPTNFENPISIIYRNFFYRLSIYSHKLEKLYIKEHILSDDNNILKNNATNISCWGISSLYGDDYSLVEDIDFINKNNLNNIYIMEIYMDYGLIYYTRTYKKIFLIISNVFPFFRLFLYFVKKFTQHIKISLTKRKLTGLIFENNEIISSKHLFNHKLNYVKNSNSDNNINSINIIKSNKRKEQIIKKAIIHDNSIDIFDKKLHNYIHKNIILQKNINDNSNKPINYDNDISNLNNILNTKSFIYLNDANRFKKLNKKDNSFKYNKDSLSRSKSQFQRLDIKQKKYLFSFLYFTLDIFLDQLANPKKFCCISKKYFTVYNYMCQIYDISTHIILIKKFNILNNMILDKFGDETLHIRQKSRININDKNVIEQINEDLIKKKSVIFSNYF